MEFFLSRLYEITPWIIYMFCVPRVLHIFQMEGYKTKDYLRWLTNNGKNLFLKGLWQFLACAFFWLVVIIINPLVQDSLNLAQYEILYGVENFIFLIVLTVTNIIQIKRDKEIMNSAKKKLVYTARAKRLMFANFCAYIILLAMFGYENQFMGDSLMVIASENMRSYLTTSFLIFGLPINILFAHWFIWPTEEAKKNKYIKSAKRVLNKKQHKDLIKIGITGSYGKTSTKFILKTILSEKYNVLATPESYNTTMGNVRVIREQLKPEHEVFISEMGARYKRDIWEICDIVNPKYGIITSIGPQHLETFKNIENIISTKAELIHSVANDGAVFLPRDNEHCKKLFNKEEKEKYSYSLKDKKADVYAKEIVLDENGSNFIAVTPIGDIKCSTVLLGEHNIGNILGCIAIAVKLGLTKEQIEAGVKKIEPIPHRLQILNSGNGTIVIDDAFNSNPVGAKMAIDVLGKFKGRKIVITPGMVELGTEEKNENRKFGKHMASIVDIAILVGNKRSEPIVEGLREGKFDESKIYVVADLNAATAKLAELSQIGDVILFENDLPDSYNE